MMFKINSFKVAKNIDRSHLYITYINFLASTVQQNIKFRLELLTTNKNLD